MANGDMDAANEPVTGVGVTRRSLLQRAGVAGIAVGAAWVAPEILSLSTPAAAISGAPATVATTVQHNSGNNVQVINQPSGTFTSYLLIVAEKGVFGVLPTVAPLSPAANPWIPLINSRTFDGSVGLTFGVWYIVGPPAVTTVTGNEQNGQQEIVMVGVSKGTVVSAGTVGTNNSATGSTITSVPSVSNSQPSTVFLIGTAENGDPVTNWTAPTGFTTNLETGFNPPAEKPPDIYLATDNAVVSSAGPIANVVYANVAAAQGQGQAVLVAVG